MYLKESLSVCFIKTHIYPIFFCKTVDTFLYPFLDPLGVPHMHIYFAISHCYNQISFIIPNRKAFISFIIFASDGS